MPCIPIPGIGIVCTGPTPQRYREVARCGSCRRNRRTIADYVEWHGWDVTCCACGYRWGEAAPRPTRSKRRRARNRVLARTRWPDARPMRFFVTDQKARWEEEQAELAEWEAETLREAINGRKEAEA